MISRVRRVRGFLRASVYLLPILAFVLATFERFGSNIFLSANRNAAPYLYFIIFATLAWPFLADRYALSSFEELYTENTAIIRSLFASGVLLVLEFALLALARNLVISRLFLMIAAANLLCLAIGTRAVFRWIVTGVARGNISKSLRVLVVGADRHAHWVAIRLNCAPLANCKVVGYVSLPGQEVAVNGAPVTTLENLQQIEETDIDNIFVAVGPDRYAEVAKIFGILKKFGKPVYAVLDFGSRIHIQEMVCQIGRLQVLNLEPSAMETFGYSVVKRVFDIGFSTLVLAILSPLMAFIALLVKITSPGPVLFRQERVGFNEERFWMYKFRTMRCATSDESDRRWTTSNDPRRTRLGIFLRKTSLDELPQLFNVLKGEMSVVGPRPERPHFVSQFSREVERYELRHRAKVGMTGWAQVNGLRGDTSIRRRVNYDLYYVQHWTFGFDLRIIFLTLRSMLFDQNAY